MMATSTSVDEAPSLRRGLSIKLGVIARQMRNQFDHSAAEMGVTKSQWMLIAVVGSNPGTTQRTIAEALEISEAAAGRLIDRLCADGLLERQPRDDDRRAYSIYLTPAARPMLSRLGDFAEFNEKEAFRGLSEAQLEQLHSLLEIVYRNVGGHRRKLTP